MVISFLLVIVLCYLTFSIGIAYWILSHANKQELWLKITGFIIGSIIIGFAALLMITSTYYSVKHRHDYYKQIPVYKLVKLHNQLQMQRIQRIQRSGMMQQSYPAPAAEPTKTK
ncbi:MAG: hypothetical protein PHC34_12175 [Candidatus Gastranaerophilales bacterium]|nr:hypothetical protein [Candidatus Gastranaerophilales bacterium]